MKDGCYLVICIKNAKIVKKDKVSENETILIEGTDIVEVGNFEIPSETEEIDAKGLLVGPGFVDIHVHGAGGYNFAKEPEKAAEYVLNFGETTVFPTLYTTLGKGEYTEAAKKIQRAMESFKNIEGIYNEGPYMNPKYGSDSNYNQWGKAISAEDYKGIIEAEGDLAKVWAIAPERDGVEEFVKYAKKVNPNVKFAVGHSEATPDEVWNFKKYGLEILTHFCDATGRKTKWRGTRGAGPDEACLLDDDMYAELISDSGAVHVNEFLQKLLLKVKGEDKIILITDANVGERLNPENPYGIKDLVFDADGDLAGSILTMDLCVKYYIEHTGCSIVQAFKAASLNPSVFMGVSDKVGSIEKGKLANLVFADENLNVKKVMLRGEFIRR